MELMGGCVRAWVHRCGARFTFCVHRVEILGDPSKIPPLGPTAVGRQQPARLFVTFVLVFSHIKFFLGVLYESDRR